MKENRNKMANVPNLRFRGFEEEWEEARLGDNCDISMCKRIFANETHEIEEIPFYKIGTLGSKPDSFITRELFEEYKNKYNYPKLGEVMITCSGTVGKCIVFNGENSYYQDSNIVWINNPTLKINNELLYYLLSNINWNILNSTTITRIYSADLKNLTLKYPKNHKEQDKIVSLLSQIDDRLSTQIQIIKELGTLIKGLIRSFIRKEVMNIQLKNCLNCHSSTLMESAVIEKKGTYPVYGATGIIAYTPSYEIDKESILIIKDGASVGKVQYAKDKYSVIGTLNYLTPKENVSLKYFYYYLQTFNFEKYKVGSGIPHIYFKNYGDEYIYCPPIETQTKIANFLSAIAEKLETEKQLLKKYTEQKKYLLANMFI